MSRRASLSPHQYIIHEHRHQTIPCIAGNKTSPRLESVSPVRSQKNELHGWLSADASLKSASRSINPHGYALHNIKAYWCSARVILMSIAVIILAVITKLIGYSLEDVRWASHVAAPFSSLLQQLRVSGARCGTDEDENPTPDEGDGFRRCVLLVDRKQLTLLFADMRFESVGEFL